MKNLFYAEITEDGGDEIEHARGHAAGKHEQVGGEALLDKPRELVAVVARNAQLDWYGAELSHGRRQERSIGIADLSGGGLA